VRTLPSALLLAILLLADLLLIVAILTAAAQLSRLPVAIVLAAQLL